MLRAMCGEVWVPVRFGVSEYTLVFRRALYRDRGAAKRPWAVVRPAIQVARKRSARAQLATGLHELFAVAICSTLALDELAYERFLSQSGVLQEAVAVLGVLALGDAEKVEVARRQIQSLVMAAEVQYIVDGMSA
jgi:hypothetical protein